MDIHIDLVASTRIKKKLKEEKSPPIDFMEVEEAFSTFDGKIIEDDRPKNKTIPPTYWFLSETFDGRILKIVIKFDKKNSIAYLRTAYDPDEKEIVYYEDHC